MSPLHNGIKRRHFLRALATVAVAAVLPAVAAPAPATLAAAHGPYVAPVVGLHFHPDAFKVIFDIQRYTFTPDRNPCRVDILYGYSVVRPELACRVVG